MSTELIILIIVPLAFIFYCLLVILIFFSPSSIKSIINGAPPIPTPKEEIKYALEAAELNKEDIFYDLGSGTGRVVKVAKKDFKADARGVEYSLFFALFSKASLLLQGIKGKIIRGNFLKKDFSDADVLYMYGSKKLMKKMEKKLKNQKGELKVVSCSFSFPNLEPEKELRGPTGRKIFIYKI